MRLQLFSVCGKKGDAYVQLSGNRYDHGSLVLCDSINKKKGERGQKQVSVYIPCIILKL